MADVVPHFNTEYFDVHSITSRLCAAMLTLTLACADTSEGSNDAGTYLSPNVPSSTADASITQAPFDSSTPLPVPSSDGGPAQGDASSATDGGTTDNDAQAPVPDSSPLVRGEAPTRDTGLKDGPYKVQSTTSGFRNGPDFADATLWWPVDATPPFASVAIVPGWVSTEGDIKEWGPFLASHGIVAITSSTNSPATDMPPDRQRALLDILQSLRDENTRSGSPVAGKLDLARQAVMGWSMGGGGALLAGEGTPSLKAVVSLCGWNRPDFVTEYAYAKLRVPSLLLAASVDLLAGGQSTKFYDSIPASTPKELFEISGADHWGANSPKNNAGVVGLYGLSWLKVYLEGDTRWAPFLKAKPAEASIFKNNL